MHHLVRGVSHKPLAVRREEQVAEALIKFRKQNTR